MRLTEIAKILRENFDELSIQAVHAGGENYTVSNLILVRKYLNNIEKANLFHQEIDTLKSLPLYSSTLDKLTVSSKDYSTLVNTLASLKNGMSIFIDSVEQTLPVNTESENLVSIKLPDELDFENLGKIIELLKKSLSIPLAETKDKIKIEAFESGSFWIDILVHSRESVELIGAITWAGAFIYKKRLEGKIHEQYLESLKIKNENLKAVQEAVSAQINILIEVEAENLQKNYYNGDDPERLERLKLSIKSMAELVEKGTEVHPSLLASQSTNSLFPSFKNLNLLESKTKQISNK